MTTTTDTPTAQAAHPAAEIAPALTMTRADLLLIVDVLGPLMAAVVRADGPGSLLARVVLTTDNDGAVHAFATDRYRLACLSLPPMPPQDGEPIRSVGTLHVPYATLLRLRELLPVRNGSGRVGFTLSHATPPPTADGHTRPSLLLLDHGDDNLTAVLPADHPASFPRIADVLTRTVNPERPPIRLSGGSAVDPAFLKWLGHVGVTLGAVGLCPDRAVMGWSANDGPAAPLIFTAGASFLTLIMPKRARAGAHELRWHSDDLENVGHRATAGIAALVEHAAVVGGYAIKPAGEVSDR